MYGNIEQIYNKLLEKHGVIYTHELDDELYMYKLLTKLEYEALTSQIEDELDLQDAIVQTCVLYPSDIDIDDMLPGDVFELAKIIVEQSCVSLEDRLTMLKVFSEEMGRLDNVLCCLIMRAFPSYRFDELENMNYPDLYRLYSRAEWYLVNILQEPLTFSAEQAIMEAINGPQTQGTHSDYYSNGHDEELDVDGNPINKTQEDMTQGTHMGKKLSEVMSEINNSGSKRKPMTEEQQRQLDEFKRQFPEMHMEADAMYTGLLSEKAGVVRGTPKQKY